METQLYTEQEVAFIKRNLPRPEYQRLLDVCCGPGRHSGPLSKEGYQIVGIDLDERALEKARLNSAENALYLHKDMRRLAEVPGQFDAVLSMWQSFGYFDEATNRDVLGQMVGKLRPDGRLILDIYNRAYYEANQGTISLVRNGVPITISNTMNGHRLRSEVAYENGGDVFEWQLFTLDEIVALTAEFKLKLLLACTECDEGKPISPEKPRMNLIFTF